MTPDQIAELGFEAAYAALQETIARLESGDPSLEESVALYALGQQLSQHCQRLLDQAELRITRIDDRDRD
jgi:exodeoxyribonuclease VII small subunit